MAHHEAGVDGRCAVGSCGDSSHIIVVGGVVDYRAICVLNCIVTLLIAGSVALIVSDGFGFISGVSYTIAKWLAIIFVVLFIIAVIAHTIKSA